MNLADLSQISEGDRRAGGSYRLGTVEAFDATRCRVRVRLDAALVTDWLPWSTWSAGHLKVWNPPAVGEQVQVQSPSGDMHNAVACPSVFHEGQPAPSGNPEHTLLAWDDGGYIRYERDTHRMVMHAPCAVRIDGDLIATGDVMSKGGDISLTKHKHCGVRAGSDCSQASVGGGDVPCA